jgi:hypothetical protein
VGCSKVNSMSKRRERLEYWGKLARVEANAYACGMRMQLHALHHYIDSLAGRVSDSRLREESLANHETRQALLRGYLDAAKTRGLIGDE